MSAEEALRAQIRASVKGVKAPRKKKEWEPPTLGMGVVLAFDQTLTNTGWAVVQVTATQVLVPHRGTLKASTALKGHEETMDKAHLMRCAIAQIVNLHTYMGMSVVCERPSVGGYRTESSLIAATSVWDACVEVIEEPPVMVSNVHMKAVLCEPGKRETKAHITEALDRHLDTRGRDWNEHMRDAVALGLTYLHDIRQKEITS